MLNIIAEKFAIQENLLLTDQDFIFYDRFIDDALKNGDIVKHNEYNFTAYRLAEKINNLLQNISILALENNDKRIDYRSKGQGVYFLVNNKIAVMTFSSNAITFFPKKIV